MTSRLLHFERRRPAYLCLTDDIRFVKGSCRVAPFAANSVERKQIITASRLPNVLSLGYVTRERFLKELTNPDREISEPSHFENVAMNHGQKYEAEASHAFFNWGQGDWCPLSTVDKQKTYISQYFNLNPNITQDRVISVGCTPDMIVQNRFTKEIALVEIKCPFLAFKSGKDLTQEEEAIAALSDKHYIQCQTQLLVLALYRCFLFIYCPSPEEPNSHNYCVWEITRDPDYQKWLLAAVFQAHVDIKEGDATRFKCIRNEGAHNRLVTIESKSQHCKFLSSCK